MADDPLPSQSLVLTLATDDSWLHVGTVAEVLDHGRRHREPGHAPDSGPRPAQRSLDFYDVAGQRLLPLLDDRLEVHGFVRAGGRAAPVSVRQRIERVLAAARDHLSAHPPGPSTPYPPGTVPPEVSGDLTEVIDQLHRMEQRPSNAHKRGWFHNLLHAMG